MYLTVKEAIDFSGKSQTTIHRLCQKFEDTKYVKKENNKYLVDKDFLMEKYPVENDLTITTANEEAGTNDELMQSLTEKNLQITELTIANKTLTKAVAEKDERIKELDAEMFDTKHELAEILDANIHLEKELEALRHFVSTGNSTGENDATTEELVEREEPLTINNTFLRQTMIITGAVMVLILFVFLLYFFGK